MAWYGMVKVVLTSGVCRALIVLGIPLAAASPAVSAGRPVHKLIDPNATYAEQQAWELGWPMMHGPFTHFGPARTGVEIVDSFADTKLLWTSEDKDLGQAKTWTGSLGSAQSMAALIGPAGHTHAGAWTSLIVAEGKVFGWSFRPSGPLTEISHGGKRVKIFPEAEDFMVAIDVNNGRTVWKAVEPKGLIWGVGKRKGHMLSPAYFDGKVFAVGSTGRFFAYRAATGEKLWQTPPYPSMDVLRHKQRWVYKQSFWWEHSLCVADGVLVVPGMGHLGGGLGGVDVETGETIWSHRSINSRQTTPNVWRHDGREYLLCGAGNRLRLLDAKTGKIIWTENLKGITPFTLSPSADTVLVNAGSKFRKDKDLWRPCAYRIGLDGPTKIWEAPDEPKYMSGTWPDCGAMRKIMSQPGCFIYRTGDAKITLDGKVGGDAPRDQAQKPMTFLFNEKTGKVLHETEEPLSWASIQAEDRFFSPTDAAHGGARMKMDTLGIKDFKIRRLSENATMKHVGTTAYQVFIESPCIAGRLFMRGEDGSVVCYDLRKNPADTYEVPGAKIPVPPALAALPPEVLGLMATYTTDRQAAGAAVRKLSDDGRAALVAPLSAAVRDGGWFGIQGAAPLLTEMGPRAKAAGPSLTAALKTALDAGRPAPAREIAATLAAVDTGAAYKSVDGLCEMLASGSIVQKRAACAAAAAMGERAGACVRGLVEMLGSSNVLEVAEACRAIPALGAKAVPAAPVLKKIVARSFTVKGRPISSDTRAGSILALRCLYEMGEHAGDPRPLMKRFGRELHAMGDAGDWYFVWMLPRCGQHGATALLEFLRTSHDMRADAVRALMKSAVDRVTLGFELERLLKSQDRRVAQAADRALDQLKGRTGKKPSLKKAKPGGDEEEDDLGLF